MCVRVCAGVCVCVCACLRGRAHVCGRACVCVCAPACVQDVTQVKDCIPLLEIVGIPVIE